MANTTTPSPDPTTLTNVHRSPAHVPLPLIIPHISSQTPISVPSSANSTSPFSKNPPLIQPKLQPLYIQVPHGRSSKHGSLSLSPSGRDVVIPTRRGIAILNLSNPMKEPMLANYPRPPLSANFQHQIDPFVKVQWNPHLARQHWIASSDRNQLLLWNLSPSHLFLSSCSSLLTSPTASPSHSKLDPLGLSIFRSYSPSLTPPSLPYSNVNSVPSTPAAYAPGFRNYGNTASDEFTPRVVRTLNAHSRVVTDLHWSPYHPDLLATCALDGQIALFDLRKNAALVNVLAQWPLGVHAVRWNTCNPWLLASIHSHAVTLWDVRMGSLPVIPKLNATDASHHRILSIDWHPQNQYELVSAGMDGHVRVWKVCDQAGVSSNLVADIDLGWPVSHVRFSPGLGEAVLAVPYEHGITALVLQSGNWHAQPVSLPGLNGTTVVAEWRSGWASANHMLPALLGQEPSKPSSYENSPIVLPPLDSMQIVAWSTLNEICVVPMPITSSISSNVCSPSVASSTGLNFVTAVANSVHKPVNSYVIKQTIPSSSSCFTPFQNSSARLFQVASTNQPDETKLVPTEEAISPRHALYTLPQEVAWVTSRYPGIKFDAFDLQSRTCTFYVSVGTLPKSPIRISIRFPDSYPNIVTSVDPLLESALVPNVTVHEANGLDPEFRKSLTAQLSAIVVRHVTRGQLCIEPCLNYLQGHRTPQSAHSTEFLAGLMHPNYGSHGLAKSTTHLSSNVTGLSIYGPPGIENDLTLADLDADSADENDVPARIDLVRSTSSFGLDGMLLHGTEQQAPARITDKDHDRRVPFPRMCGVAWSPSGKLALFSVSNMMKVANSESRPSGMPRSFDQYLEFRQALDTYSLNVQNKPVQLSLDTVAGADEDEDMLISNLYYPKLPSIHATDDILNRMRRKLFPSSTDARSAYLADSNWPIRHQPSRLRQGQSTTSGTAGSSNSHHRTESRSTTSSHHPMEQGTPPPFRTASGSNLYTMAAGNSTLLVSELLEGKSSRVILLLDMSHLLPFDLELASAYSLTPTPTSPNLAAVCRHNGYTAMHVGRPDLSRLWSMAELIVSAPPPSSGWSDSSGSTHALGESMIEYIFSILEAHKDLQSLAVFACVFAAADLAILAAGSDKLSVGLVNTPVTGPDVCLTRSPSLMLNDGVSYNKHRHVSVLQKHFSPEVHRHNSLRHAAMPSPPQLRRALSIPPSGTTPLVPGLRTPRNSISGTVPMLFPQTPEHKVHLEIGGSPSPHLVSAPPHEQMVQPPALEIPANQSVGRLVVASVTVTVTDFREPPSKTNLNRIIARALQYAWYMSGYLDILHRLCQNIVRAQLSRHLVTLLKVLDTQAGTGRHAKSIWAIVRAYVPSHDLTTDCGYECPTCTSGPQVFGSGARSTPSHLRCCVACQRPQPVRCSLCRGVLRGIITVCPACGHGGHPEHMHAWFSSPGGRVCPAKGCECRCSFPIT